MWRSFLLFFVLLAAPLQGRATATIICEAGLEASIREMLLGTKEVLDAAFQNTSSQNKKSLIGSAMLELERTTIECSSAVEGAGAEVQMIGNRSYIRVAPVAIRSLFQRQGAHRLYGRYDFALTFIHEAIHLVDFMRGERARDRNGWTPLAVECFTEQRSAEIFSAALDNTNLRDIFRNLLGNGVAFSFGSDYWGAGVCPNLNVLRQELLAKGLRD